MNAPLDFSFRQEIIYPDSDGLPMADNTLQFEYIVTVKEGLNSCFRDDPNVFIAGDLLWYPVEGNNKIRVAPDVLAAFGRPKGHRGSYRQWVEDGVAPQVVFEILSPGNRLNEMIRKFQFYERYGVEEYYVYDPDNGDLFGYLRQGDQLIEVAEMEGWRSPRLGIRFQRTGKELELYQPDGRKFATYLELYEAREKAQNEAAQERQRAESEKQRAETEKQRAEIEKHRADRLQAQLKALGIKPED